MPQTRLSALVLAAAGVFAFAAQVQAGVPEPRKPFSTTHMPGRWYEIARTPNKMNRDCEGGWTDWASAPGGRFKVTAVCHKGDVDGPVKSISGMVAISNPPQNTKVRMSMLGGLIGRDYWIFDHAADYGWLIMGTPDGAFISIESRTRTLAPAVRAEALGRARGLGFDTGRLIFPAPAA